MNLLKRLRLRLTAINAVASGIILLIMALGALFFARQKLLGSAENAFAHAADTIAYQVQSQTVISYSDLTQAELNQGFILHIEDSGVPFMWPGVLDSKTPREGLVQRAQEKARLSGVDVRFAPLTSKYFLSTISGDSGESYRMAVWVLPGNKNWSSVTILKDRSEEQAELTNLTLVFMGFVLLSVVALGFFSFAFAGRAIRPIDAANRLQKQFVQAASHELRTPIAVIEASADALLKANEKDLPKFAHAIEKQSRQMARLVDDMLFLASADMKAIPARHAPVELDEVMREVADSFRPLMEEHSLSFTVTPAPLPLVFGDEARLRQVIEVLLDNAMEYTPAGGEILLTAAHYGREVQISVSDTGPGIPVAHKAHIFDRFYRADESRSRAKAHYGLGLSIAYEIITQHGGKITVADHAGGGTVFTLHLKNGGSK